LCQYFWRRKCCWSICIHNDRVRRIQIATKYARNPKRSLCDAFTSNPLPIGIVPLVFKKGEGAVLNTQFADCIHIDANCPYVTEEQRLAESGERSKMNRTGEVRIIDITEIVPGDVQGDACEMPCCDNKLQFQIWDPNTYRNHVEIHPNGHDKIRFVRNGITRHGRISNMNYEEAEAFFDEAKQVAASEVEIHNQISAVSDYIHKYINFLGSKPLSEANNPVFLWGVFHPIAVPAWLKDNFNWQHIQDSVNTGADIWMYDKRLFDIEKGLDKSLAELQRIPEGILPCIDSRRVLRDMKRVDENYRIDECFYLSGILKPLENNILLEKGLSHFLDIREVSYHAYEHYWGNPG
jgi:hypothetical protein